jgi:hypothetical protein
MCRRQRIETEQPRYENRSQPTEDRVCKIVGKGDAGESDLRWKRRDHDARNHCYDADGVMPYPVLRRLKYGATVDEALSDAA